MKLENLRVSNVMLNMLYQWHEKQFEGTWKTIFWFNEMDNRRVTNKQLKNGNKFISKLNKLPLICFLKLNFCLSTLHAVPLFECDWMSSIFLTL